MTIRSHDDHGCTTAADLESWLQTKGSHRDALAHQIRSVLNPAAFGGSHTNPGTMISLARQAEALIAEAEVKAS